jgi:hypothetical protein
LRRIEQATDAAFGSRERLQTFIVRERPASASERHLRFCAKGAIQFIVGVACRGEAAGLRQRLVDLNLALHIAPPVFVF